MKLWKFSLFQDILYKKQSNKAEDCLSCASSFCVCPSINTTDNPNVVENLTEQHRFCAA